MDATDRLRALLDEREVEWEKPPGILEPIKTVWRSGPWEYEAIETRDGYLGVYAAHCDWITPEQAVEATLGREQPPYEKLVEVLRRDWDIECSWDGLRRFWYVGLTDEGVRKRDEREAALGRGECHMTSGPFNEFDYCSECGGLLASWIDYRATTGYCPSCGARVIGGCR